MQQKLLKSPGLGEKINRTRKLGSVIKTSISPKTDDTEKPFANQTFIQGWVSSFSGYLILHQGCELENKNITPASEEQIQKELLLAPLFVFVYKNTKQSPLA